MSNFLERLFSHKRRMLLMKGQIRFLDSLIEQTATSGKEMTFPEMCLKTEELAKTHDKVCYLYEMPNGQLLACLYYLNNDWLFKAYPGGRNIYSVKGQSYEPNKSNLP